jgi:hypothetical protein
LLTLFQTHTPPQQSQRRRIWSCCGSRWLPDLVEVRAPESHPPDPSNAADKLRREILRNLSCRCWPNHFPVQVISLATLSHHVPFTTISHSAAFSYFWSADRPSEVRIQVPPFQHYQYTDFWYSFCEEDFVIVSFIAEFVNTCSNAAYSASLFSAVRSIN